MAEPIRIRATETAGLTTVRVLMAHPMESGQRKDAAGRPVPAHHITDVLATHNGRTVLQAQWSGAISQNPYLQFKFRGAAKGDKVQVQWADNKGERRSDEATVA